MSPHKKNGKTLTGPGPAGASLTLEAALPAAVIFDLDGTLLDTEPLYTRATDRLLEPHGCRVTPELKRQMIGRDAKVSAGILIDAFGLPFGIDEYLGLREKELQQLFPAADEIPGAGAFLEHLAAKGIPLGIATSSHAHLTRLKLADRPWRKLIQAVVSGDDPRLGKSKPAPDIFLLSAADLGASPEQCLAFEDSPNGIKAALAAGMRVIGVQSPYMSEDDFKAAEGSIRSFLELIPA